MKKVDYFQIIHKYIPSNSPTYQFFLPHAVLVTHKALDVARRLQLDVETLQFVEEASMLHDIGIVKVNAADISCIGELPYICHGIEGRKILDEEGLPQHALVAERHTGVGLTIKDIEVDQLPLPKRDMTPQSIAEKIICYADKWYSKNPQKIWKAYSLQEILAMLARFPDSEKKTAVFQDWVEKFE